MLSEGAQERSVLFSKFDIVNNTIPYQPQRYQSFQRHHDCFSLQLASASFSSRSIVSLYFVVAFALL